MSIFNYQASLRNVVDGDTIDLTIDLGFGTSVEKRIRLRDVDTAEIHGIKKDSAEYRAGIKHKEFTATWLAAAADGYHPDRTRDEDRRGRWPLTVESFRHEQGAHGRYLGVIARKIDGGSHRERVANGQNLGAALLRTYDDVDTWPNTRDIEYE